MTVGDGVIVGVDVLVGDGVIEGVTVGPNNCPEPQLESIKLIIRQQITEMFLFMIDLLVYISHPKTLMSNLPARCGLKSCLSTWKPVGLVTSRIYPTFTN